MDEDIDPNGILPGIPQKEWVVYALQNEYDEIVYVGMSGCPRSRIRKHLKEFGDHITRVIWADHDNRRECLDIEAALIKRIQPRLNLAGMPQ